ncbi:hypothetical protein [Rickettsiella endosymbiont of Aleochara curtula]|uniref:hypothetical protein n=1 Tax=Rickettsiella endosymbiont of Aleochara curtula TaxID=3077936 RepID=UPI00313CBC6D
MRVQKSFVEKHSQIINSLVALGVFGISLTAMLLFPMSVPTLFALALFSVLAIGPWIVGLSGKGFGKNFCALLAANLVMIAATLIASPLVVACAVSGVLTGFAHFASKSITNELVDATQNTQEEKSAELNTRCDEDKKELADKKTSEFASEGNHLPEERKIQYHVFTHPASVKNDAVTPDMQQDVRLASKVSP